MGPGCSRDVGAAARARAVKRPSFHWIRSRCCSMRLPGKRVSSLLPEAKQSIPRREAEVTVQQVTSHCISRCTSLSSGVPGWIKSRRYAAPGTRKAAARRNFLVCHAHALLEFLHHLHALPERHLGTGVVHRDLAHLCRVLCILVCVLHLVATCSSQWVSLPTDVSG